MAPLAVSLVAVVAVVVAGLAGGAAGDGLVWTSPDGAEYPLAPPLSVSMRMANPKGATMRLDIARGFQCGPTPGAAACITVPGLEPQATGMAKTRAIALLNPQDPARGLRLTYENGEFCAAAKRNRRTLVDLICSPPSTSPSYDSQEQETCTYHITVKSQLGCPKGAVDAAAGDTPPAQQQQPEAPQQEQAQTPPQPQVPALSAVTGCPGTSEPRRSTSQCPNQGQVQLLLHGNNFEPDASYAVQVGDRACTAAQWKTRWLVACLLGEGYGPAHGVTLSIVPPGGGAGDAVDLHLPAAVFYKPLPYLRSTFDSFERLGVGGLTEEINELYRRVFQSRSLPANVLQGLGITHAKGILLYGPPGSGKTLVARTIGKLIGTEKVTLINTPDIMQKYLGESEKQLRNYFEPAEKEFAERGKNSDLHILIFDEIDAIFRERGSHDGSAASMAYDSVVNALLTKMDGLEEADNIVVFGMTNRKELVDSALLRPGRFEVQLEIGLPDLKGRREIFGIHTREMRKHGLLGEGVNLQSLAERTPSFSGAEIAGVVRNAASFTIERSYSSAAAQKDTAAAAVVVTASDFDRALKAMQPAFGVSREKLLAKYLPYGILECGAGHAHAKGQVAALIGQLTQSRTPMPLSVLLYGDSGVGKTALAVQVVLESQFEYIKILSPEALLQSSDARKVDMLAGAFTEAAKAKSALIILDNIEGLVEMVRPNAQEITFSRTLVHALTTQLQSTPPPDARLFIIATSQFAPDSLVGAALNFPTTFSLRLEVPLLGAPDMQSVAEQLNVLRADGQPFDLPPRLGMRSALAVIQTARYRSRAEEAAEAGAGAGPAIEHEPSAGQGQDSSSTAFPLTLVSQATLDDALRLLAPEPGPTVIDIGGQMGATFGAADNQSAR